MGKAHKEMNIKLLGFRLRSLDGGCVGLWTPWNISERTRGSPPMNTQLCSHQTGTSLSYVPIPN